MTQKQHKLTAEFTNLISKHFNQFSGRPVKIDHDWEDSFTTMENYKIHDSEPTLAELKKAATDHGLQLRITCEGEYQEPGIIANRINIPVVDIDTSTMTGKIGNRFTIG